MRKMARTPYTYRKEFEKELPDFDPTREDYTQRELELYANRMLREDRDGNPDGPRILFQEHIEPDWRREVLAKSGTIDEEVTKSLSKDGQMMYNRQHPQGRRVNSEQQRKTNGASYYRAGWVGLTTILSLPNVPIYIIALLLSIELALYLYENTRRKSRSRGLHAELLQQ